MTCSDASIGFVFDFHALRWSYSSSHFRYYILSGNMTRNPLTCLQNRLLALLLLYAMVYPLCIGNGIYDHPWYRLCFLAKTQPAHGYHLLQWAWIPIRTSRQGFGRATWYST